MNVSAALDWLFSTQFFGIKLGLDNTEKLLAAAGADRINATVVHVAGTNGKGSTCAMIEALARAQGYVTGLFTSPHLVDFSERIRVNGNMITPDALAEEISFLKQLAEGWEQPPTFFELALAVALRHFRKNNVNFIILETGLGGRLDATNAVPKDIAVLAPHRSGPPAVSGRYPGRNRRGKSGHHRPRKTVRNRRAAPGRHGRHGTDGAEPPFSPSRLPGRTGTRPAHACPEPISGKTQPWRWKP